QALPIGLDAAPRKPCSITQPQSQESALSPTSRASERASLRVSASEAGHLSSLRRPSRLFARLPRPSLLLCEAPSPRQVGTAHPTPIVKDQSYLTSSIYGAKARARIRSRS